MAERNRMEFTLTDDHVALLRRMNVGWQDCEAGAPEIDPKRPYGNSSVAIDVADILGWPLNDDDGLSDDQRERAMALHRETQTALQIVLATERMEPGLYYRTGRYNGRSWVKA